jgi:hypothetical protein
MLCVCVCVCVLCVCVHAYVQRIVLPMRQMRLLLGACFGQDLAHVLPADQGAKSPEVHDVMHVPFTHVVTQSPGAGKPMDLRATSEVCTNTYIYVLTSITEMTCTFT